MRFGKLTVIRFLTRTNGRAVWWCDCECGRSVACPGDYLKRQARTGCGCGRETNRKHGDAPSSGFAPEYKLLNNMLSRCNNPNTRKYHLYGGRGIRVCDEWNGMDKYPAFLAHVGRRPSSKHSLDRWPNRDGNYEPGNVRWATNAEQNRNMRTNKMCTVNGETACVVDMCRKYGIGITTARARLNRGWSDLAAFTTPPKFIKNFSKPTQP